MRHAISLKTLHLEHINKFIVISDVHLRDPKSPLTQLFIQELDNIQNVDAVFLLGDIFDFIAAPVPFFLNYWKSVFDAFQNLKNRGVKVYFIEGNHDFGFDHFKHARFLECFTECGDFAIVLKHSVHGTIVLKHGDDCVCAPSYHVFRQIVKSSFLQKIVNLVVPGSWMQAVFSRYALLSRRRDPYRTLSTTFMDKQIQSFLKKHYADCDVFIMGHIHQNVDKILNASKRVRVLIGDAWFDRPNLLEVTEKEICRKYLS